MTHGTNGREQSHAGSVTRRFSACAALLILVLAAAPVAAEHPVQIYYLPLPEEEILTAFQGLDTRVPPLGGDTSIRTVISITVTQTDTIIYYDQWENDFEPHIDDPDDLYSAANPGGTQIWGDADTSNGFPPGIPGDVITGGDVITLDNIVPASPRVPANIFFDGGDKIATTWPIAVTRAAWPVPTGPVIGGAVEVFPTRDWDTDFQAPVGENLGASCTTTASTDDLGSFCMFQDSRLLIMARQDGTQVAIDVDGDGNDDISQTLDEGESFTVDGAQAGSLVTSTAPVQVNELTGDVGATFEARWFALVPLDDWSDSYLAPVGTVTGTAAGRTANASVSLFNPHSTDLTINVATPSGTSPVTVLAGGVTKFIMPGPTPSSGAGFTSSDGRTFFALAAADDERSTHDWGHTVLPESSLSIDLKVGWAPGSDGTNNSSPVWITSRTATTVCADFDDNGVPDQTFALTPYQSLKIYDPDGDQSGLRVFSTTDSTCTAASPKDGALLAGAWGQDPFTALTALPALDLGTTVLQVPPIILAKEGALAVDVNGNGLVDPGDALRYAIGVLNSGTATATDVTLSDTLDPNTSYIVNTTTRDAVPVPDDSSPATPFPLDEGGLSLGNLGPGVRTEIEFLVEVDPNLPAGTDAIVNQAIVTTGTGESSDDSAAAPVFDGNPRVSKLSNVSGSVLPGDVITYSIAPRNDSLELQTNVEVADTIPSYTTFVGGSASPPQDSGPDPLVWDLGSNVPGTPGSNVGGYLCGEVVDLPASQDTFMEQDAPTANRSTTNPVITRPETDKVNRALFQFDLSGLPAGATVSSAVLTIQSNNTRSGDFADVKRLTTAWTETANWNTTDGSTAWGTAGGDFDSSVLGTLTPDSGQQQADITSLVQNWVNGTQPNYGVILDPRGVDAGEAQWESREDGTESRRPFIRAAYTFTSPGGCPSTVQLVARQDTYIEEDDVSADNSTANTLQTRPQPAGQINRALYQFFHTTIPADAIIDSAILTITSRNNRSNHLVDVKRITTFWSGSSTTWNSPWTTPGGDFSSVVLGTLTPVGGDAQETADITALVQDWVDGTLPNYGVILDPRGADAGDAEWSSREEGDESRHPYITVTYRSPTVRRSLAVTQDTFIDQDQPTDDNSGDDPVLTRPEATNIKRALFQFESGGIPSNATINSAALLVSSANARSNHLANVKYLTSAWTESANWNTTDGSTSWTSAGGDFAGTVYGSFTPVGGDAFGKVDVTPLVQDWVDGTLSNYGVILDPSGSDTGDAQWNSREDGTASRHAYIDVSYLAASLGASTTTAMTAEGSLVTDGDTMTVTMELTSSTADTNVTPGSLLRTGTNGAGATCGSPSPASQGIAAGTPITFVWTCTANAGATPGSVTFGATAAGDSSTFAAASSNSVLVSPLLTFQVTVDDPLDLNVTNIFNTAEMTSDQQPDPNKDTVVDPVDVGAAIGNSVWLDVDGDGIQDVGEDGLANVVVELRDGVCIPAVDCPTTTTDANGNYLFAYLGPGTFTVAVLSGVPTGLVASPGNSGGVSDPIVITGTEQVLTADFGYTAQGGAGGTGAIGNYIWSDADGDGLQDPGEPGIGGVTVDLMGPGADGILGTADDVAVVSTTTEADGTYLFTGVAPGQYQVAVTDTAAVLSGYSPTSGPQSEGGTISAPVTVAAGSVASEVDFGFDNDSLFSISDSVWVDSDGDGVRDVSEVGIAGVTVNLQDAFGNIIATTTTDASGNFSFDGLPDDSKYLIQIADVTGQLSGLGGTTAPAQMRQLSVGIEGASFTGTNFGYNAPASLRGVIWNDADGDGVQDPEEIGLGGVTVELQNGCTPGVDCPITTTAPDGSYSFVGLRPELYTVEVTDAAGALTGYTQTGDPDEPGACSVCDSLSTTVVNLTTGDQSVDFGYRNGSLDDISGRIFDDEDADGVEDPGESGLAGVTVVLLDDAGNVLATTTTDASGDYVFPDLPTGNYSVRVTDDAGFLDGYSLTSGLDELSAQPGDSDVDFGYTRRPGTAAIGDRLWLDADGDGQAGPNEAGLAGVTVELWEDTDGDGVLNPANDTLIASTVTDANGDYVFDGLSAGNYLVDVDETTLPVTASGDLVETSYPAGTDPSAVIALSATERFGGADFGYLPASGTAVLGDRVWYDADGNGLQDPGELGIGGVEIQLLGPGCDPTPCTVTTEPDGSWLVTGLAPGDFLITYDPATLPAGYNTIPTNLEPDDTYGITVAANDVMTQLDFGFDGGTTGTIGDRVWLDEDGDGAQDAGEPGLAGVTVNLLDSSGNIIATTTTAADGSYLFSGVPDGDYTVSLSDIDGVLVGLPQSYDPDEAGVCTTCDKQGSVSVSGGVSTPADVDFGFAPSGGTGTIGDFVWHDADGDGVQDPGESGIQGVTLELWLDVNGDGVITPGLDNLVRNAVTDQNGEYQFSSLPDEDYVVRVTDTAGVVSAFVQTGDPDEAGTCTVCDGQGVLSLAGGSGDFGQDFGYAAPAGQAYVISGTVFDDESRDGIFDDPAESGVEAALVMLFNDLNGDGVLDPDEPLIGSTVTDADGNYSLADLPPGDYLVAVDTSGTTVDGYLQSTQTATAGLQPVEITTANVADQDFGFWSGGPTTTPVTLAYFGSEGGGNVTFEWATATETGNLGFHLYVLAEDGMRRLNETLIPSQLGDALAPQRYALEAWGVDGDQFLLEDVDLYGQTRYHGPFELGRTYGNQVWNVKRTDWVGIRREHHRKAAARRSRRLAGLGGGSSMGSRPALGRAAPVYLRVREDGLYRVTYEALVAAGVDLAGFPASKLALLEGGQPVPIRVGGPGRFGPGSFVEFVGRGLDTLYTDTNVYTLKVAPKYAARVGHDAGLPSTSARIPGFYYETRTAEFNRAYDFAAPGDDPWYDTRLLAISGPVEAFFELELEDRLPEAGPVELTVELWGVTDFPQAPDHHVVLEVNGVELADEWFDGFEDRAVRTEIPDWLLGPDSNRLRVLLPHDTGALYDLVNYDHYRLRFPRRFEAIGGQLRFSAAAEAFRVEGLPSADVVVYRVTQEGVEILEAVQISSLAGAYSATFTGSQREATYYVSTVEALQMPLAEPAPPRKPILDAEAEMLIIAHPDFVDSLDPLVAARRLEGLSVQVVNVEELYRRFSHGVFDPQAIRKFIRRAYRDSGARYVLLVGGDTYDYFDYLGGGAVSFLPTLYTQTDPIVRFAPVDPLYGDINSDGVPEVAVGRWPVRTTAELEAILDRTLRYADIDYVRTAVFSADAYDAPAGYSFSAASEEMLGYLPETWQAERVYLDELPLEEARQLLIDEIDYGVALTSYFGHSGPSVWSFDGLFDSSDADALENFGRPTVITQWGCWNTYHVMPTYDTLGHRLLLNDGRGAAAVLGAATLTEALSEQKLGRRLFAQIGSRRQRLGKALIDAKKDLALTDPERLDVLLGWTLLGDPTLVVEP